MRLSSVSTLFADVKQSRSFYCAFNHFASVQSILSLESASCKSLFCFYTTADQPLKFDVSKVSIVWNFVFQSFSNTELLLHHTRPKHSFTPSDASKPHKHTYKPLICSHKPPPVISGQFSTTIDTKRHQTTPTDVPRQQNGCLKMCGRSG